MKHPLDERVRGWLIRLAGEYLDAEVKRFASERQRASVHIEDDVRETPPAEAVSTLGDEILDFYEPDEDLKLEDIIPDLDAQSPEEEAERSELRQCVDVALAGLPRQWRRALLLRDTEGLTGAALATALHRTPAETERILDNARAFLRQHLVQSGCRLKESETRA